LNASPANAGVHISTARAAGRWVPAFAGTAARAWFHLGQVGCPAGTKLAMTRKEAVIARSPRVRASRGPRIGSATKQSRS